MPEKLPEVKILQAFEVTDAGATTFEYPKLEAQLELQRPFIADRWQKIEAAPEGSVELIEAARALGILYQIKNAHKLHQATSPDSLSLWTERFNQNGVELYGMPADEHMADIASSELCELRNLQSNKDVDQAMLGKIEKVYSVYVRANETNVEHSGTEQDWSHTIAFLKDTYGELLLTIQEDREYSPFEIRDILQAAVRALAQKDSGWADWNVPMGSQGNVKVDASAHEVIVGEERRDIKGLKLKGLLAHELLVHALRRVNAEKYEDEILASGLPGYVDAEEGLGIFVEYLLTDKVSKRVEDRYFDTGLALGLNGREPMTRQELYDFVFARNVVRSQADGEDIDHTKIAKKSWQHVYRTFRGGTGALDLGKSAVFTKDIAYYEGFLKMKAYFGSKLSEGYSTERIFRYVTQGKFDPTDELHQNYVSKLGINLWSIDKIGLFVL